MINHDKSFSPGFSLYSHDSLSHQQESYANIKRLEKPLLMNEEWIQQNNTHDF